MRSIYASSSTWHHPDTDVHHALLGNPMGGGVAYLGVLCNSNYGYGLSTGLVGTYESMGDDVVWVRNQVVLYNIHAHTMSYRHTFLTDIFCRRTWIQDFMVVSNSIAFIIIYTLEYSLPIRSISLDLRSQFMHEVGHNFDSGKVAEFQDSSINNVHSHFQTQTLLTLSFAGHTHDGGYNPRIDTCGCSYSNDCSDPCSSQLPLADSATIMSYCHICRYVEILICFRMRYFDLIQIPLWPYHVIYSLRFSSHFLFPIHTKSSFSIVYKSGGYGNMDYTFGGKYNGSGDRSVISSYINSPSLVGDVSSEPRQVNAKMYSHVSTRGECLSVPVPTGPTPQPTTPGVSCILSRKSSHKYFVLLLRFVFFFNRV